MARIRSIKPEFWTDEKIVQLPMSTRLFFIGLFNFSDDYGAFEDKPDQLHYQIFPGEPEFDPIEAIDLLEASGLIERGINSESGDIIFRIKNFEKHQKVDRPTKSRILPDNPNNYRKAPIPAAARRALAIKYGCSPGDTREAACYYCGLPGTIHWQRLRSGRPGGWVYFTLEIDHLKCQADGGDSGPENLVLACRECNRSKYDANFYEFLSKKYGFDSERSRAFANARDGKERKGKEGINKERDAHTRGAENENGKNEEEKRDTTPLVAPPPSPNEAVYRWAVQNLDFLKSARERSEFPGKVKDEVLRFCAHYSDYDSFNNQPVAFFKKKFEGWLVTAKANAAKRTTKKRDTPKRSAADEVTREKVLEHIRSAHGAFSAEFQERDISALIQASDMSAMRERCAEILKGRLNDNNFSLTRNGAASMADVMGKIGQA